MIIRQIGGVRVMSFFVLVLGLASIIRPVEREDWVSATVAFTSSNLPSDTASGPRAPASPSSVREAGRDAPPRVAAVSSFQTATATGYDRLLRVLHTNRLELSTMRVTATGYTAGPESTGKTKGHPEYGITYSGVRVRRGTVSTIAADPHVLPIGTLIYVPGYGYGVVADTGSAIHGKKIDLYFETKQDVFAEWGKKDVEVTILKKGEGTVTEDMLQQLDEVFGSMRTHD